VLIEEARRQIAEQAHLHAFISVSSEVGQGTVVAVKDLVDVRGLVTTAGAILLPDQPAAEDAPVVGRLRDAGMAIIGKSTTPEFGWKALTDSPTRITGGPQPA
jgi:Asp-tRNA(Asn)/Glu-tRNA(Gln) amidotransferase A subunit family amidase